MDTNYTHIAMVIDRSGSMSGVWNDVSGGYETLVKKNKKAEGKCTFTVAAFDTEYDLLEDFTDIKAVKEELAVTPRGGTALLDAIGKTIVSVGEKLSALPENERPAKVFFVIQTDGHENASKEFKKPAIQKLITEQTEKYNWQFSFIGASLEAVAEARSYGILGANTSAYNTRNTKSAFEGYGDKMVAMRACMDVNEYGKVAAFSDEEKDALTK